MPKQARKTRRREGLRKKATPSVAGPQLLPVGMLAGGGGMRTASAENTARAKEKYRATTCQAATRASFQAQSLPGCRAALAATAVA